MDLIKKDVIQIKEKMGVQNKPGKSSSRSVSTWKNVITVGLDDIVYEVTNRLAGGEAGLQIIPIMGMGGIGKTTLARTVYSKPVIKHYFDICSWATVSQEYNVKEILTQVYNQDKGRVDFSDMSVDDLGEMLYKHLSGRRYLIVIDDIWNIEAWDRIKFFFPDYRNGSQIIVTTRMSKLACSGSIFPSSASLLWNLQTLIVYSYDDNFVTAPVEIWNMPQLRHIFSNEIYLPDPPSGKSEDDIVLQNLQTLKTVVGFNCGEEVVKRIPNIKKLGVEFREVEGRSPYSFDNLYCLDKLESFSCYSYPYLRPSGTDYLQTLNFPRSLKKLNITANHVHWEDLLEKMGSLPLLEKLTLTYGYLKSREWETVDGQFPNLKSIELRGCDDLEYLTTKNSHFPSLEYFHLVGLEELKEIPSDIGDIPTLKLIELIQCSDPIVISARRILDEREELGEEGLLVKVSLNGKNQVVEDLASPYFQVEHD